MNDKTSMQRRQFMILMGVLPAAGFVAMANRNAWALESKVEVTEDSRYRYIRANGIPDHTTGSFPNRNNPNRIETQNHHFRVPLIPEINPTARDAGLMTIGIALNGIPFDPAANEFWKKDRNSGWRYEALSGKINLGLDQNNAHVQPNGAYHYHGLPTGLIRSWSDRQHSPLIGYAADGFPIYVLYGLDKPEDPGSTIRSLTSSYQLRPGTRNGGPGGRHDGTFVQDYHYLPQAGDLDECNGRLVHHP
ncbi:YHYH protein [Kiloniella laminariae]|uniref:YHYH protein n=1 Tax=Kiloniella laminariae TaxID=454162 RepID=UPI00037417A9|nr:YHYH protein [Kiloniella laminariae]